MRSRGRIGGSKTNGTGASVFGVIANKDQDYTSLEHGPETLAVLPYMALNVIQTEPTKESPCRKLRRSDWNKAYFTVLPNLFEVR